MVDALGVAGVDGSGVIAPKGVNDEKFDGVVMSENVDCEGVPGSVDSSYDQSDATVGSGVT